jgi:hypothetical protein
MWGKFNKENEMITFFDEQYTEFGLIVLWAGLLLILLAWRFISKDEKDYQKEFKNYGE